MITLSKITHDVKKYLSGDLQANSLISVIDDAVSSDSVYDYPGNARDLILRYQDILSYFVEDEEKRNESSSFYGPDKLKAIVSNLESDIARLAPSPKD